MYCILYILHIGYLTNSYPFSSYVTSSVEMNSINLYISLLKATDMNEKKLFIEN